MSIPGGHDWSICRRFPHGSHWLSQFNDRACGSPGRHCTSHIHPQVPEHRTKRKPDGHQGQSGTWRWWLAQSSLTTIQNIIHLQVGFAESIPPHVIMGREASHIHRHIIWPVGGSPGAKLSQKLSKFGLPTLESGRGIPSALTANRQAASKPETRWASRLAATEDPKSNLEH